MAITALAVALVQEPQTLGVQDTKLLIIFVFLVALSMLVIAAVVVALGVGAMKAKKELMVYIGLINGKVQPILERVPPIMDQGKALIADLTPQVQEITRKANVITGHVQDIAGLAREKAHEFAPTISAANQTFAEANQTVKDVNHKTYEQVQRVNGMISGVLDATTQLGKAVERGIKMPGRELSGLAVGVRTGIENLWKSYAKQNKRPMYKAPSGTYEPASYPPAKPDLEP